MRSRCATAVLALSGATLLAGCGSTVQLGSSGSAAEPGLTGPLGTQAGIETIGSSTSPINITRSSREPTLDQGNTPAPIGSSYGSSFSDPSSPTIGRSTPGVTATQILVGFGTAEDANKAGAVLGLQANFGDQVAQANAIVADINKRGGVLGRKIKILFHDGKTATDQSEPDASAVAQCNDWTQDHHVFAGINIVADRNRTSLFSCMAKAKTPLLISDLAGHSVKAISAYAPYLYAPGVAALERWVPTWVEQLDAAHYFTPWNTASGGPGSLPAKIGLAFTDNADGRLYLKLATAALKSVGRNVTDTFAFAPDSSAISQIPQMVLKFRSDGVTHMPLPLDGYLVTPVAQQQGYHPRYGVTTLDGLSSVMLTTSPKAQLVGSIGIGWFPSSDVNAAHDPGDVSSNETRCKQVMDKASQHTSDRLALATQLITCDLFDFLTAALTSAGHINVNALQSGAASLDAFPSALAFSEHFGPRRYDGTDSARTLGYSTACSCYVYSDKANHRFPH